MMTAQQLQPDELERLVSQVRELEDAGVFERTPVEVASLVQGDRGERPRHLAHRLFIGLQVAAGLGLAVGLVAVWRAGMATTVPPGLGNASGIQVVSTFDAGRGEQVRVLARCFTGPAAGPLGDDCRCVDFDSDGDVDLADYGAFQVVYGQGR